MAQLNPTVIAAHLDDEKLRTSIQKLVADIQKSTQDIKDAFDTQINHVEQRLKNLGNTKVNLGGIGNSAKEKVDNYDKVSIAIAKAAQKEKAVNQTRAQVLDDFNAKYKQSIDKVAAEQERLNRIMAQGRESAMQSMRPRERWDVRQDSDIQRLRMTIHGLESDLKRLDSVNMQRQREEWEKYLNEIVNTRKKIMEYRQEQEKLRQTPISNQHEQRAIQQQFDALTQKIREAEQELSRLRKEGYAANSADYVSSRRDELTAQLENAKAKVRELDAEMQRFVASEEHAAQVAKQILDAKTGRAKSGSAEYLASDGNKVLIQYKDEAHLRSQILKIEQQIYAERNKSIGIISKSSKTFSAMDDENEHRKKVIQREKEYQESLLRTGQVAQQASQQIIKSMHEQASISVDKPIMGLKELTERLQEMNRAYYNAMNQSERETPLGQSLKRDIENAKIAIEAVRNYNRALMGINIDGSMNQDRLGSLERMRSTLSGLVKEYEQLGKAERNSAKGDELADKIQRIGRNVKEVQKQMNRPISLSKVLGMDESTLDRINDKLQALRSYKMGLKLTDNNAVNEMRTVDNEITRLTKDLQKWQGETHNALRANDALTRSWKYMKNRLAFYLTVGATQSFVKQLIDVRGQYEMLERSIGILVDSARQGTKIFAELNAMALKSPFTTMELGAAAKQLVAYDIKANEVVDTVKRLGDMAAAVGIPIERLTYALGQIKAYGYLNARDARMFSNAGIPLVKELADHYTTLEGRMVSTADVYDRIKKKAIGYNDVMSVVNRMTDQGGKFFNFQEKVADTLRMRIASLTLAWNNMLNEMGRDNQGLLTGMLTGTKKIMEHWRDIYNTLLGIGVAFVAYKAALLIYLGLIRKANAEFIKQKVLGQKMTNIWNTLGKNMATATNFAFIGFTALAFVVSKLIFDFVDLQRANEQLNKSIVDGSKENIASIEQFFEEYEEHLKSIGSYSFSEQVKVWERLQEEIEKTSNYAEGYIDILENISNIPARVEKGAEILDQIEQINKVVQSMADKDMFDLGGGFMGDNMLEDLDDFETSFNEVLKKYGDLNKLEQRVRESDTWNQEKKDLAGYRVNLAEATNELQDFGKILDKANLSNIMGQGDDEQRLVNLRNYTNGVRDYYLATEKGQKVAASGQALINEYIDQWIARKAFSNNLINKEQFLIESNRTAWEIFFQQLNHEDKETMDILRENHLEESEEFKKIWDKAAESMKQSSTYSYNIIKDQIAALRNTPDIVLRVIYRISTVDADDPHARQRQSFVDKYIKPNYVPTIKNFKQWQAELKQRNQKYGRFNIKDNEDNVEYEKRLGQQYQNNAASIKSLNKQLAHGTKLTEASRKAKEEELKSLQEEQKTLEEIRNSEGFDYDQFAKGGKGTGKKKGSGKGTKPEDEVAKALKDELSIIKEMQSNYEKLRKVGFDATTALNIASSGYEGTLSRINAILAKFGVEQFKASDFVSNDSADPNKLLKALEKQRASLIKSGKVKTASLKDLDVEIQKLTVDAKVYNMQKITDGLNREFEKLHNDYELSVELDANPELGDMFADMFSIDRSKLPHNMADLIKDAQKITNDAIKKYNKDVYGDQSGLRESQKANLAPMFDVMSDDIDKWAKRAGIDIKSDLFEKLKSEQDKLRDQYKNYMMETEKDLDDYVKKYGITADRIAEIEAERLRKLNNLNNEYYNEELRKLPEYQTKLDAINKGAAKEKDKVWFDDFKSSELYAQMFDRIEDVSTATLELLRGKVKQVKESLDELDPTQVKELTQQFAKIDEELIRRNPYKGLVKNYKEYISALKNQKQVEQDYIDAQKNYDAQMEVVAALEEQLKQKEYQQPLDTEGINSLKQQVIAARNLLKYLKQILGIKEEDNEENKKAISKFQKQAQSLANELQDISKIVSTIGSITEALGVDEDTNEIINDIAQSIEGVSEMAQGMAQMTTNPIAGVTGIIGGLWKTVSGWFDNANKRIDRKIKKSEQAVNKLELAYIDLERAVSKSLGNAEIRARKLAIENKRLQLAQLQNQLRLEQSRSKKNRDDDKIVDLQKQIKELNGEIADMMEDITNNLLGSDIKSAAEDFVNTWVDAWRQGEDTMEALNSKFTEMIDQMIMKSLASKLVATRLKPIWDMVDSITDESSEGGTDITLNELKRIKELIGDKSISEAINQDLKNLYGALGIAYGSGKDSGKTLSNLQQGIQSITEDTANALEAITSGMSQQVYYHSTLLEQIRDAIIDSDSDIQLGVQGQILLQLQTSYQTQQAIRSILEGWSSPNGMSVRVEMI